MNRIENAFMTRKQNGETEVVLLTSKLLKDLRVMVACHWQAARTTEVESSRWRKAKQEEPRTQIDGHHGHRDDHHGHWDDHHGHWDDHHGHWDDHQDLWSEYLGRSLDTLANISLAQFVINYRSGSEDGNHSDYKNTIK